MKIRHYLTLDTGGGPVSLVSIEVDRRERMIRITHEARFGRVMEVDPEQARAAVTASADLGMASTAVPSEHSAEIARETLAFVAGIGCRDQALRWGEGGQALLFANEEAAASWDSHHDQEHGALVRRRRRVMMD